MENFSGTPCPKPTKSDTYTTINNFNFTSGTVSPFASYYGFNGIDGVTVGNFANRLVFAQPSGLPNINYRIGHGCGPYLGVQVTVTFRWGAGALGPQYISVGRGQVGDFNGDGTTDTLHAYLKITPSTGPSGVQATRYASISPGSTGMDGPAGPVVCAAQLGGNTLSTAVQSITSQFEQISIFGARLRYSDSTNIFSSSDSVGYMGSGCDDGSASGIRLFGGSTVVTLERFFSNGGSPIGPTVIFDSGPATVTVADRPVIKSIKIETRKVYPDFSGGNL